MPFTLDTEIIGLNWVFGDIYCICYRYFYYCFLFFLPLTLLFLSWHLFVENCKWNFAGEEGAVPRPWPHTIYIPLIWFFSLLFAVPTIFWSDVRPLEDDFYRNEISYRPNSDSKVKVLKYKYDCKQTAETDQNPIVYRCVCILPMERSSGASTNKTIAGPLVATFSTLPVPW